MKRVLKQDKTLVTSHLLPAGGGGGGGGGYIQGVSEIFLVMYGGGENKMTYGQGGGGSCISSGIGGGGSDVFHWSFFSLKVIASGGGGRRPPYILSLYTAYTLN